MVKQNWNKVSQRVNMSERGKHTLCAKECNYAAWYQQSGQTSRLGRNTVGFKPMMSASEDTPSWIAGSIVHRRVLLGATVLNSTLG